MNTLPLHPENGSSNLAPTYTQIGGLVFSLPPRSLSHSPILFCKVGC